MEKQLIKKGLVFGIIMLFVGTSVGPSISGDFEIAERSNTSGIDMKDNEVNINIKNIKIQKTFFDNPPIEKWNTTFGGTELDEGQSVQQTTDGGYIISGTTQSYGTRDRKVWLIKTDCYGNEQWNKTFDGDYGFSVQQTNDEGYIIGGGWSNVRLIKTDSYGNEQWNKTFGGGGFDRGYSVQQTVDGGYIIIGMTESYGAGGSDGWLIKTDGYGDEQWSKTFGTTYHEQTYSGQQTTDGGYIIVGLILSNVTDSHDVWLIKTDGNGNKEWDKTFGGANWEEGLSVQQTTDGGYIITGYRESYGPIYNSNVWLVKTNETGSEQWNNTFGGTEFEKGYSVEQTTDGGYIITGYTNSYGAGEDDVWLIKTDGNGNKEWDKTFGGYSWDWGFSGKQTTDGGFIITGMTSSYSTGDHDVWLIKLGENQPPNKTNINGPNSGKPGKKCYYVFNSIDPEGDDVKYIINWGDNTSDTTDFNLSGTNVTVSHTWTKKGTYIISVKAEDVYGAESDWATLEVTIPRYRAIDITILRFFESHPLLFKILQLFRRY